MVAESGALPVSLAEVQAFARVETGEEEALLAGLLRRVTPVRAIEGVERIAADGSAVTLPSGEYEIDIDSRGDGWVKVAGEGRVRVSGRAGMAGEPNGVPEPLRQGIVRLAAHLFANRDGEGGEPPAAVTALWRPYRRMRLA